MGNRSSLLLREDEIAQIQNATGCKYPYCLVIPYKLINPNQFILVPRDLLLIKQFLMRYNITINISM